jgi:cyclopropane fatty-acyl-phospholipid synthase-like methyltransferase
MSRNDDFGRDLPIGSRHYRAYVGPPEKYDLVAAMQFNLLTHLGLREFHYLLDIGCGSLRAGRLFIPYLLPGHYYGIEPHAWLIEEGIQNELGRDILQIKQPVFSYNSHFDCERFNQKFDFVVAQSVFSHASRLQIQECLTNIKPSLQPNGMIAATFAKGAMDYDGDEWVYPECVNYTVEQMTRLSAAVGLSARTIDWHHPNGQTWIILTHSSSCV